MNVVVDFPKLLVADRCDVRGCGAQAFVITLHMSGFLYWCGHHFTRHQARLVSEGDRRKAVAVHDARHTINKAPSQSATV